MEDTFGIQLRPRTVECQLHYIPAECNAAGTRPFLAPTMLGTERDRSGEPVREKTMEQS